tara:strand:- start:248 stop:556 length:309 start_codon:yes stop_codon:yes gene_type:complete
MKVSELKIGMLVECANPEDRFIITTWEDNQWLRVVTRSFRRHRALHQEAPRFGIYLGTKKEIQKKTQWSNRFLLVGNQIVAVDPSCWRIIKPMTVGSEVLSA